MAFALILHGALDACKVHVTHTHPILQRCCEQEAYPDGDVMSQAKTFDFLEWLAAIS